MTKTSKKNIFDYLVFGTIGLFFVIILLTGYPLINNPDISLDIIKNKAILPAISFCLIVLTKILAGHFIWMTNAFDSLDSVPLFLLFILIILIALYFFDKDKEYMTFAKYIVASFIGSIAQQIKPSKKDKNV